MRVLFFGMRGRFSLPFLQSLQKSQHDLLGVIIPGEGPPPRPAFRRARSPDPLTFDLALSDESEDIAKLAQSVGLPLYHLTKPRHPDFLNWLTELAPDVICVACFNRIFPPSMLAIPRHGVLNVHPSLLPHYRGPEPLFWQLRDGLETVGVTVHWMDEGADTGPIADRCPISLDEEMTGPAVEERCAQVGAALLVNSLDRLANGDLCPQPQPPGGSAQPMPTQDDFTLPLDWSAERAFRFVHGTAHWGVPYAIAGDSVTGVPATIGSTKTDGRRIQIQHVVGWKAERINSVVQSEETVEIPFAEGTLIAVLNEQ